MKIKTVSLIMCLCLIAGSVTLTACRKKTPEETTKIGTSIIEGTSVTCHEETLVVKVDVTDEKGSVIGTKKSTSKVMRYETVTGVTEIVSVVMDKSGKVIETIPATTVPETTTEAPTVSVPKGANPLTSAVAGNSAPSLVSVITPAVRGSYSSIIISGKPDTEYTLSSDFKSTGLGKAKADKNGIASWSFAIPKNAKVGDHIFKVTNGKDSLSINITIK